MGREYKIGDEVVIIGNGDKTGTIHYLNIGSVAIIRCIDDESHVECIGPSSRFGENTIQVVDKINIAPNFKVGDLVKIRKDSKFYGDGTNNPKNKIGKITKVLNNRPNYHNIYVDWNIVDYVPNSYRYIDLEYAEELIEEPKIPMKILPIEELPEVQQKNQVLIASLQLLSSRKYVKVETILDQLKINQPEYEWNTNIIYNWLEKLDKFRQTKTGNFALKH